MIRLKEYYYNTYRQVIFFISIYYMQMYLYSMLVIRYYASLEIDLFFL